MMCFSAALPNIRRRQASERGGGEAPGGRDPGRGNVDPCCTWQIMAPRVCAAPRARAVRLSVPPIQRACASPTVVCGRAAQTARAAASTGLRADARAVEWCGQGDRTADDDRG